VHASAEPRQLKNSLLSGLPDTDRARLVGKMRLVSYGGRKVLYELGEPIEHVYFPESAVISLLQIMNDGTSLAIAAIGYEGMLGVPIFLGEKGPVAKAVMQIAGQAYCLSAIRFKSELEQSPVLRRLVEQYTHAFVVQIVRSAGCNLFHSVRQRCAQWLLMIHDRAATDEFSFTHGYLADMLGIQRQTATVTLQRLETASIIQSRRGKIRIANRKGLEAVSCECYWSVKREFDRLSE
jgi:cAMP-binding proteins - catabolite gene activator and regulatory subunit of cAMP-dependent protein kinases